MDWPDPRVPIFFRLFESMFPRLRVLDISALFLPSRTQRFPPTLEKIRLHRVGSGSEGVVLHQDPTSKFPKLRSLILSENRWVTIHSLRRLLEDSGAPLQVLHVDNCEKLVGNWIPSLLKGVGNFDQLVDLNVSYVPGIDDSVVSSLVDGMQNLKVLDLSGTRITGCMIKRLADLRQQDNGDNNKQPKIEWLGVKDCQDVSPDAVAYGRQKGMEVVSRSSLDNTGIWKKTQRAAFSDAYL